MFFITFFYFAFVLNEAVCEDSLFFNYPRKEYGKEEG